MESLQVAIPVADMRHSADHRSQRVSQALYGHSVMVIEVSGDFARCESADGYSGWIGRSYLTSALPTSSNVCVVTSLFAIFDHSDGRGRLTLPYGARIVSAGGELFHDIDGSVLSLVFGRVNIDEPMPLKLALDEAESLVSVPYLWGGSSTFGYDCSGFTQAVYRRAGIQLPRDSKDQSLVGREVTLLESVSGDLIFFPGHVAIHLGNKNILHASRLRGVVAIESFEPGHRNYRSDLDDKITTVRRLS